jgi:WD40 repeat protein
MRLGTPHAALVLGLVGVWALPMGCGSTPAGFTSDASTGGESEDGGAADGGAVVVTNGDSGGTPSFGTDAALTVHDDFANPLLVQPDGGGASVPSNVAALFGSASQGAQSGGPCLTEPAPNALLPRNWLRPLFRWTAPSGENLFELRIHAANQTSDLLVFTSATSWTMPQSIWNTLSTDSNDVPMTVSIRGGALSGGALMAIALGSSIPFGVAPADAPGTIVYWTTADGTSLKGFQVGDESVGSTLLTSQVQQVSIGSSQCLGCHTGSPDGNDALFSTNANNYGDVIANINPDAGTVGGVPPFAGAGGIAQINDGPLGINTVSKAYWSAGQHMLVASNDSDLVWINLDATDGGAARGTIARSGTPTGGTLPGAPSWSHDGKTIAYVSTNYVTDGRLGSILASLDPSDPGATADLFTVPYNGGQGGTIAPVTGATDPNNEEFYPAFSPDDTYLAFDKAANGLSMYNQAQAELYVIPSKGGTPSRLHANDPPACSGAMSPGVTNSWPKWSPSTTTTPDGRTFYWIVFSSTRLGSSPQLFITAMVIDAKGNVDTYGALYLWNQPPTEGNHTPAWEYFNVPAPPPPMVIAQ